MAGRLVTVAMRAATSGPQGPRKQSWIENSTWTYCVECRWSPGSEAGIGKMPDFVTDCGHIYRSQCKRKVFMKSLCTANIKAGVLIWRYGTTVGARATLWRPTVRDISWCQSLLTYAPINVMPH